MTRGNPPEGYCTATVALRRLGNISDGKFRSLITDGKIERIVPPGAKQGFYKIADINRLIQEWNQRSLEGNEPTLSGARFSIATKEDMPGIVQLLIKVFGGGDTSAKRNAWLDRNPEIAFVVKSHNRVRGCIFILPLREEKIRELLAEDNYATGSIDAEDILPFEIGVPTNLFLLSMASDDNGVGRTNRRKWGSVIVRGLFNVIEDLGRRGIPVNLIASRSSLPDGIRLMRHIGFWEMEPCGSRKNFVIEVPQSGLGFVMKHKAALKQWKQQQA